MKVSFRDIVEFLFLPVLTSAVFVMWDLNKNLNTLNVQVGILNVTNISIEKRVTALEAWKDKTVDYLKESTYIRTSEYEIKQRRK